MTPPAETRTGSINLALVLVASLLLGFVGGYLVGQRGPIPAVMRTATAGCPHDLDPSDAYIVAGFICPNPAHQDLLINCHCEIAHALKDRIKQELSEGKDGTQIRRELEEQYGARLQPIR
ncbi:MAG TPA: hypothetical protein VM118_13605 [Acidobacteriota bacterium]|nr:hypothetical protein [Acidobacteriota bacterium]